MEDDSGAPPPPSLRTKVVRAPDPLPSPPQDVKVVTASEALNGWWYYRKQVLRLKNDAMRTPLVRGTEQVSVRNYYKSCVTNFQDTLDAKLASAPVVRALPPFSISGDFVYNAASNRCESAVRDWSSDGKPQFLDKTWFLYAYECKVPIVGSILISTPDNHFIAYLVRFKELILLEPYDTDWIEGDPADGKGLRAGWRNVVLGAFQRFFKDPEMKLSAPMQGEPIAQFNLQDKDAHGGQCGYWAMTMLERFALNSSLLKASPDAILADFKSNIRKGGRRRRTRRVKRSHRRTRGRRVQSRRSRS